MAARILGPLGAAVMGVLWRRSAANVGEIEAELNESRTKALSYKTVLTICARLEERGLLSHVKEGRAYRYRPLVSATELLASEARKQVAVLMERFGDLAVSTFLEEVETNPDHLRALERLLEESDEDRGL